jgi:3-hydroxyacyl-CoA dehydrogenase/enoyl-CoA hydratase/3-hydroxybutyryl-CoA epimerase
MTTEVLTTLMGRIHSVAADAAQLSGCDLLVDARDDTDAAPALPAAGAILLATTASDPMAQRKAFAGNDRVVGFHLLSPVERTAVVEVVRSPHTTDQAFALALDYAKRIRKTPFAVGDGFGFYVNRVVARYAAEGALMFVEGVAPALIENAARGASMTPPLAALDDLSLDWLMQFRGQTQGQSSAEAAADRLLAQMAGNLGRPGRAAGKGFYDHAADGSRHLWAGLVQLAPEHSNPPAATALRTRLLDVQALEAVRCLEQGIVREPADADVAALLGWGFAAWSGGPLSYIDTVGVAAFVARCEEQAGRLGERFAPPVLLRTMAQKGQTFYPSLIAASG